MLQYNSSISLLFHWILFIKQFQVSLCERKQETEIFFYIFQQVVHQLSFPCQIICKIFSDLYPQFSLQGVLLVSFSSGFNAVGCIFCRQCLHTFSEHFHLCCNCRFYLLSPPCYMLLLLFPFCGLEMHNICGNLNNYIIRFFMLLTDISNFPSLISLISLFVFVFQRKSCCQTVSIFGLLATHKFTV